MKKIRVELPILQNFVLSDGPKGHRSSQRARIALLGSLSRTLKWAFPCRVHICNLISIFGLEDAFKSEGNIFFFFFFFFHACI